MKMGPMWFWIAVALDLLLLVPALYMAEGAVEIAYATGWAGFADGIGLFFVALPVFCIACPAAAFRVRGRPGRSPAKRRFHAAILFAAPFVYAVFLVIFVVKS
jgi:hypothetical protein